MALAPVPSAPAPDAHHVLDGFAAMSVAADTHAVHTDTTSVVAAASTMSAIIDLPSLDIAAQILRIIERYRISKPSSSSPVADRADEGALTFLALIYSHVKTGNVVPMCLPAFPFKSPNSRTKVLGKLPDKAEEVALSLLNGLCQSIQDIYPPGAQITIISDGLVYNDLLGVPDRDVWNYGEALRVMASEKGLANIQFARLRNLVSLDLPDALDEMTYVANATNFRRAFLNTFSEPGWDWSVVSKNPDVCMTYRGYLKFLQTDLETVYPIGDDRTKSKFKRGLEYIAKEMMSRGDAFARAVRQKYKDHVRLSIHPSTGATKLSISLLPTTSMFTTPWHCTVAYMMDGTVTSAMKCDLDSDDRFELVHERGRPSYYREKSELFSWAEAKGGVTCSPIYPCGWLVHPAKGKKALSIQDVDAQKVRRLAEVGSPVVLRGFASTTNRDLYVDKATEFGEPTPWKFGLVLEVKDQGSDTRGLNNVLSAEWMPFHFDGLFKTMTKTNDAGEEMLVPNYPRFQYFVGATASPKDTGFTIFSSSTGFFSNLPPTLSVDALSKLTWSVQTSSFNSTVLKQLPLVVPHPTSGKPCLRYHEPWPASKTKFEATYVNIEGTSEAESARLCAAIDETLHDRRVAYYHSWDKGDMVISDNILMMHTRSDFNSETPRELWRIHFD